MCDGFWECEVAGQIATWLAAFGTIAAVMVALSLDHLRWLFHRAKLDLRVRQAKGNIVASVVIPPANDPNTPRKEWTRYYHLLVINTRPRTPATQVQVYLTKLEELDAETGEFVTKWTGDTPLQWRYQHARPDQQTIGHGAVDCDLCAVLRDKWMEIFPHPKTRPVGLHTRWRVEDGRCDIILTLVARGVEAVSTETKIRIFWDGKWAQGDEEMSDHLTVKRLKP